MVAIACILAAVFIPVAFLGGISGQIYRQFALTIAVSVLLSAFNALSLSSGAERDDSAAAGVRHADCLAVSSIGSIRLSTGPLIAISQACVF